MCVEVCGKTVVSTSPTEKEVMCWPLEAAVLPEEMRLRKGRGGPVLEGLNH